MAWGWESGFSGSAGHRGVGRDRPGLRRLAAAGWAVTGASRRGTSSGSWTGLVMNVDDEAAVTAGVNGVLAGHGRIDALVAAAGWGIAGAVEHTTVAEAKAQVETNFWGTVRTVQAVLGPMREQGGGRIVLLSSIGGVLGIPFQAFYSASKFALEGLAEALAYEVQPFGIHVTLVQPGNIATDFTASRQRAAASAVRPGVRGGAGQGGRGHGAGRGQRRPGQRRGRGGRAGAGQPAAAAPGVGGQGQRAARPGGPPVPALPRVRVRRQGQPGRRLTNLYFFERGLPGYSWYVPKARGWLNVGVGGMASRLKPRGEDIWLHWQHLAARLKRQFGIELPEEPSGYSYYLRGPVTDGRIGNAFLTGDAAGLATRDLCEGIGPAIRSGQRAAEAILNGSAYDLAGFTGASLGGGLLTRWMDWAFTRGANEPVGAREHRPVGQAP